MFVLHLGKNIPTFKRQTQMHTLSGFIIFRKKESILLQRKKDRRRTVWNAVS